MPEPNLENPSNEYEDSYQRRERLERQLNTLLDEFERIFKTAKSDREKYNKELNKFRELHKEETALINAEAELWDNLEVMQEEYNKVAEEEQDAALEAILRTRSKN